MLEKTIESLYECKEIKQVNPKGNQSWIFIGRTDTEAEAPIIWPPVAKSWLTGKDWCWERLKAGGEGDNSGWDGWMVSPTQWTWVWANSGRWWMSGTPGVLQSMGLQRVGYDWVSELTDWLSLTPFWLKFTFFFATSQTPISWKPYVGKNLILEAKTPDFKFQLDNHTLY